MNYRRVTSTLLLVFVAVSAVYLAIAKDNSPKEIPDQAPQVAPLCREGEACNANQPAAKIAGTATIAYYFHRTARCRTCRALESNAREAIQSNLADELAKGQISIQALNVEEAANRHYIEQYQITGPSLVLSYVQDGKELRWKNLDQIWTLIRNPAEYQSYVASETKAFISGKS